VAKISKTEGKRKGQGKQRREKEEEGILTRSFKWTIELVIASSPRNNA
jgi:hypothetical protein